MKLIVAPTGVALPEEAQREAKNAGLMWTLAGVAGSLVRGSIQVVQPVEVSVTVARADDVASVWAMGTWVMHGSDLRAGTLGMFCQMVRRSRAKSGMAAMAGLRAGTLPRFMMSLLAGDEGIPVGIIVQSTADPVPVPMLEVRLGGAVESMWLASTHINIVARIGEPKLRAALAAVAKLRAANPDAGAFRDRIPSTLEPHSIAGDEAIACMVLEQWERDGGAARMQALRAMVAP